MDADVEVRQAAKVEASVAAWLQQRVDGEMVRLTAAAQRCIPVPVLAMAVVRETEGEEQRVWNHVEFKTAFDFSRVKQILLGDTTPCPLKRSHTCVLTVLVTDSPLPLLFAYLYDASVAGNDLQNWVFVNTAMDKVKFRVDAFV